MNDRRTDFGQRERGRENGRNKKRKNLIFRGTENKEKEKSKLTGTGTF